MQNCFPIELDRIRHFEISLAIFWENPIINNPNMCKPSCSSLTIIISGITVTMNGKTAD